MHRTEAAPRQQHPSPARTIQRGDALAFLDVLTGTEMRDCITPWLPPHRDRLFPPEQTLALFLAQVMSADGSCQDAVNQLTAQRQAGGLAACSTDTGAYCRARQRLPLALVRALSEATSQRLASGTPEAWQWRGRAVRLVDGTTLSMPDTAANQAVYPQPGSQAAGLGFPQCRLVGLLCLGSGALLQATSGPCQGKGSDEQTLLRRLLGGLEPGNLLLGDAFFATYFLLAELSAQGIDGLFEQHGARRRSTDFRRGQRLGSRDHLIVLTKPKKKPDWMPRADYERAPDQLTLRELRVGGKVLVTTLLCPEQVGKSALQRLYWRRWQVELDLRDIKTTLGMATLRCRTPAMIEKEIQVYLLAYNLIRWLMATAASSAACRPRQLSFKHSLQLCRAWWHAAMMTRDNRATLASLVTQQRVGNRPGRIEPRARKRRPKPYPLLTVPRDEARAHVRQHGHPKKQK